MHSNLSQSKACVGPSSCSSQAERFGDPYYYRGVCWGLLVGFGGGVFVPSYLSQQGTSVRYSADTVQRRGERGKTWHKGQAFNQHADSPFSCAAPCMQSQ